MLPSFLRSGKVWALTLLLAAQASAYYTLSHGAPVPLARPLAEFPRQLGTWRMTEEGVLDQEVKDVLRADDYLTRMYQDSGTHAAANLYVAFFKTQQTGQTPHSPKNCLPGSGWLPSVAGTLLVDVPGRAAPVEINKYIVSRGDSKAVVLYWYQSRDRVVASEYRAKVYVVLDSLRYHRSDTSLVRVVVGVGEDGEAAAQRAAVAFVQSFFVPLRAFLPA